MRELSVVFLNFFKKINWTSIPILFLLLLFDLSIHPLTMGPDRRIHDPAVYRLENPNYLQGDWYTETATESGIYIFFSKVVHFGKNFRIQEESWRQFLYLIGLVAIYYSMINISEIFSKSFLTVPIIAIFHSFLVLSITPEWIYGQFIQVDGGLAPRTLGVALSFLSLLFLLKKSKFYPWIFLGVATLIHVSNSFIIFTLFFIVWFLTYFIEEKPLKNQGLKEIFKKISLPVFLYILAGGWFAFYIFFKEINAEYDFSDAKFIWAWIYFRAPYMILKAAKTKTWIYFFLHLIIVVFGWCWLRKKFFTKKYAIDFLALSGLGSVLYFFIFYFFTFIYQWLPGFQFYSIRIIYFLYFVAYFFIGLLAAGALDKLVEKKYYFSDDSLACKKVFFVFFLVLIFLFFYGKTALEILQRSPKNLGISWGRLLNSSQKPSESEVINYLSLKGWSFMAPPDLNVSSYYLPAVVTYKSFGFTRKGLEEWYVRMNDLTHGELEKIYNKQKKTGKLRPVSIDWKKQYSLFTPQEILSLSEKYKFKLFLSYRNSSYPFEIIKQDDNFILYKINK